MVLDESDNMLNYGGPDPIDLFATWFLIADPHLREGSIAANMGFGFRETFSGAGIFVFKQSRSYKIMAAQNLGNEQTTLTRLSE